MKICTKCLILKENSEFYKHSSTKDKLFNSCKSCHLLNSKTYYYQNNKERLKQDAIDYAKKHRKQINLYQKNRRQNDILFRVSCNLRSRLRSFIKTKNLTKNQKFNSYIGCSLEELKKHLENQFQLEMTWENYGDWHIDHIIPLASAKTEEELYNLCHYLNLQPLWAKDNMSKGRNKKI